MNFPRERNRARILAENLKCKTNRLVVAYELQTGFDTDTGRPKFYREGSAADRILAVVCTKQHWGGR